MPSISNLFFKKKTSNSHPLLSVQACTLSNDQMTINVHDTFCRDNKPVREGGGGVGEIWPDYCPFPGDLLKFPNMIRNHHHHHHRQRRFSGGDRHFEQHIEHLEITALPSLGGHKT
ncbi:hypothetical protein RRG08_047611 [Elysia crispata]|uniref:Uncharacterized protein n=1 Tax=Elysia crispata TaxID=231223 RepID=A0AAE1BD71_9GAST|nr:hypothetical protein RRG08_047611 [Elysia crispata]